MRESLISIECQVYVWARNTVVHTSTWHSKTKVFVVPAKKGAILNKYLIIR